MLHHFFASSPDPYWVKLLLITHIAAAVEGQSSCVPRPISIPIGNVSIANSPTEAVARGIAIDIGDPPQSIAFLPDSTNKSFVYSIANFCPKIDIKIDDYDCFTVRGGEYNTGSSTKHKARTSDDTVAESKYEWVTETHSDLWRLSDQVSLQDYTFEVPLNDSGNQLYRPQALLGLGRNSTLLRELRNEGLIASRTWSYYWGRDGRNTIKTNGSLVLGGYDQDKVTGTYNYTANLNYTLCDWGTQVEISDISIELQANMRQSLFGDYDDSGTNEEPSLPLYACIDPGQSTVFELPYINYMRNFVWYTNFTSFNENEYGSGSVRSQGLNYWNLRYLSGVNPYRFGMYVDIKDGPSISVQNEQLVVPHVYMDNTTSRWQQDMDSSDLLIISGESDWDNNRMTLGRYFMTNTYIMVNQDVGKFTIWSANIGSNHETLVAVDENGNLVESSSSCATDTTTTNDPPAATNHSSGMTTGSIVGIAIGCAAALGIFALGIWWFMRRRKQRKAPKVNGTTPEAAYQASWATPPPPFSNDPTKPNGNVEHTGTMLSTASFIDTNHPSGISNPSELSSTPTYGPHHEMQG